MLNRTSIKEEKRVERKLENGGRIGLGLIDCFKFCSSSLGPPITHTLRPYFLLISSFFQTPFYAITGWHRTEDIERSINRDSQSRRGSMFIRVPGTIIQHFSQKQGRYERAWLGYWQTRNLTIYTVPSIKRRSPLDIYGQGGRKLFQGMECSYTSPTFLYVAKWV